MLNIFIVAIHIFLR